MCQAGVIVSSRLVGTLADQFPTIPTSLVGFASAIDQDLCHNASLMQGFQQGRLEGDLLLFIAADSKRERLTSAQWAAHCSGLIHAHEVPCTHAQMTHSSALVRIGGVIEDHLAAGGD
jgi:enterobactin synthetase component F